MVPKKIRGATRVARNLEWELPQPHPNGQIDSP
jgi:hypothetical protein